MFLDMRRSPLWPLAALLMLAACVTVNVYFPAAAAERAADLIICDVYGHCEEGDAESQKPAEQAAPDAQGSALERILRLLDPLPAAVAAEPNINISTPAIGALQGQMTARHQQLAPHYSSGAIGMTGDALITVRDAKLLPLKARNAVNKLVADENRDRNALYAEIAKANGNPQWERDIRRIFAQRWVANAESGWWYESGSGWSQK
jgi:uncharacterized protein YdbL (DUF1318 family)